MTHTKTIELADPTGLMLAEIANKKCTRDTVARTYCLAMRGSVDVDWKSVNLAIVDRWSFYALEYIKKLAWSGKCFEWN